MRKLLITVLCIISCLLLVMPCGYASLDESSAKDLMYQYCEDRLGYTRADLEPYSFIHVFDGGWAFSLKIKDADPTTNGLITGQMTENGDLLEIEGPEPISLYEQLYYAWRQYSRNYKEVYRLKQEWEPLLSQLSAEAQREFNIHQDVFPMLAFVSHDIQLPSGTDIPYEEARAKAEEAILAMPGWTQEMLSLLMIDCEAYHVPMNSDRPVYQFVYNLGSDIGHRMELYGEALPGFNYDKQTREEKHVFGEARPSHISVSIDAQTGELFGEIYVEVLPDFSGDAMVFLLW